MGVPTKRVIATRPLAHNQRWCDKLQSAGFDICAIPLLAIEPLHDEALITRIKQRIIDFDHYQGVIFVSQNAVQFACDWLEHYWPQMPEKIQYFAVGTKTAQLLRERMRDGGARVNVASNTMNSEELLEHPLLQQVRHQKLLICRGLGGRTVLADALRARGAEVDYCELYRRVLPAAAVAEMAAINLLPERDILIVFSGETLANALQVARDADQLARLKALPLLVPGERVASLARAAGFDDITVAANAAEDTLLQTLINGFTETRT